MEKRMNKQELINLIESLKIDKEEFVILSSGALVLRGIMEDAGDLDLAITEKGLEQLKNNYELNQQLLKLDEVEEQIFNKYAREANEDEISELLGVTLKRAKELKVLESLQKKSSLEDLEEKVDKDTLEDSYKTEADSSGEMIVEGIYYETETAKEELTSKDIVADEVMRILMKDDIKKALEFISERERKVLILRFGLENNEPKTFEEIGKELNLTRSRIQAIMYDGLRKIRNSRHNKLKNYMDITGKDQDDDFIER